LSKNTYKTVERREPAKTPTSTSEKSNDLYRQRRKSLVQRGRNRTKFEIVLLCSILPGAFNAEAQRSKGAELCRRDACRYIGMICEGPRHFYSVLFSFIQFSLYSLRSESRREAATQRR
jgi:hypothetical protein